MRFLAISSKICVSAAVFYSTFSVSKCRASDIPVLPWRHDNEIVHIYRTEVPWTPIEFEGKNKNDFAFMAWVAIISVAASIACIVTVCCVCCRLCHRFKSRRQSANTALVPSAPEAIVVFQADASSDANRRIQNSTTTNNIYGNGVVNFAFTGSLQDPHPPNDDFPPEYAAVVSQTSPTFKPVNNAFFPQVSGTKTVETPPPAYLSVAPFQ